MVDSRRGTKHLERFQHAKALGRVKHHSEERDVVCSKQFGN